MVDNPGLQSFVGGLYPTTGQREGFHSEGRVTHRHPTPTRTSSRQEVAGAWVMGAGGAGPHCVYFRVTGRALIVSLVSLAGLLFPSEPSEFKVLLLNARRRG